MAKANYKEGYRYGLLLNQEKYPVIVHRPGAKEGLPQCGRTLGSFLTDRRRGIEVAVRLLDGDATVFCQLCWKEQP